ncbi:PIN/TRAM domain-containing protein [Tengunoibacter tsumagoiensis]|uniref:PIN/TRAM domain-containing protein n=1 Tax=Tengunoibacter tsumagoiensis TaxID=2014871 RepID=A0A402A343_9CHLR|nr:PIN domain-containing protein [Tengunoibacter tsumagoiensis]GCE13465.1 PIN/TRAM domain-containing protein [Tengunoibacter tsumagoiensis]
MFKNITARIVGALCAIALIISMALFDRPLFGANLQLIIAIGAVSAIIAFIITPYITVVPYHWLREKIRVAAASDLVAAAIGLMIGLIISALLALPLSYLPWYFGRLCPFIGAIICGYLGVTASVLRKNDIAHLFQANLLRRNRDRDDDREPRERGKNKNREEKDALPALSEPVMPILLDTSTIIDGRIADISQTGFIAGTLVVPRFVLNELQRIADSADTMRRNRGRRGLEILNRLQKDATVPIEIIDTDVEGIADVDGKLVQMARDKHCPIITNDFNLNRVAELQGVKVLNINELANAIKPVLLPGEDIHIKIMQDGKELGQGVGYLDDGTMIVVENGRQFMNMTIEVSVTRVLQTVAGRMIFAHPKQASINATPSPQSTTAKQRQL